MDHCESWPKCKNNEQTYKSCPKFTEQTIYVCKYLSQQSQFGSTIYPYPGTWQDQPEWFIMAYGIARNKLNRMQSAANDKKT